MADDDGGLIDDEFARRMARSIRRLEHTPESIPLPEAPPQVPYYVEFLGKLKATLHSSAASTGAKASIWAPPNSTSAPEDTEQEEVTVFPWFLSTGPPGSTGSLGSTGDFGMTLVKDTKITVGSFGGRLYVTHPGNIPGWFELKTALPSSGGSVSPGQHAEAFLVDGLGVTDTSNSFVIYDELGIYRGREKDKYSSPHNDGSKGKVRFDPLRGRLIIEQMTPHALQIMGTINESTGLSSTDSSFDVDNVYVMQPPGAIITDTDPASGSFGVTNREFDGDNNDEAILTWDENDVDWKALDVMCPG